MSLESLNEFADVPKVAIVGRPNVGKSTLFNILTDTRKAVVKDQRGVTRDLMVETAELWGKTFDLIDTGGITESKDIFSKLIKEQVSEFLSSADLILLVMDGRDGLVPEDRDVVRLVQETGRPFALIVNKIDRQHEEDMRLAEFYEFGVELYATSFENRQGLAPMLEWLHKNLPETVVKVREGMTISIVGKPNAGKSSLVNCILGEDRMLVSAVAGTTIDAVDTPFHYNGRRYTLVDTAGLRRSARREEDLEIISAFKSHDSIRKSDLVLLVIDALLGPSDQDARILQSILEDHKGVIVVANKIDEAEKLPEFKKKLAEQFEREFHFFDDIVIVPVSAKTGKGIKDLLAKIQWMDEKMHARITTSELNDFFFETIRKAPAPVWGTTNVKFYYLTQTKQLPPSFVAFANHPDGVDNSYRRFLIKNLKDKFDLWGVPIRIFCMKSRG